VVQGLRVPAEALGPAPPRAASPREALVAAAVERVLPPAPARRAGGRTPSRGGRAPRARAARRRRRPARRVRPAPRPRPRSRVTLMWNRPSASAAKGRAGGPPHAIAVLGLGPVAAELVGATEPLHR
jgi:hypothetical protein